MIINGEEHSDLCIGIDLGTTNSVISAINVKPNGDIVSKVLEVPRAVDMFSSMSSETKFQTKRLPILPSCVWYNENGAPLVGDFAKSRYSLRPHQVAKSIKSQMGNAEAEGFSDDVPDKRPAQISARILRHMLGYAEKTFRTEIHDAIVTVPANFTPVMCQATRDAAELAGIIIRNNDGTEREILLSEPNAVIYDFINQVRNGEISSHILDLSEKKNVVVFDLGGGTLDITLHEIVQRSDYKEALRVNEIATNRYTLLGGDDFDEALAQEMYNRYLAQYKSHPEIIERIKRSEKAVMAQMRGYAEELKITISSSHSDADTAANSGWSSGWDNDDEEDFSVGGNISVTGYSYDDSFSQNDIEQIFETFMGRHLAFEDFKNMDAIEDTRNIIYPILDVLAKTANQLGEDNVRVDAVIMNGGMSRFYMVIDRLRDFFGLEPICVLDPDQSVARGAAVYHYLLHKYAELKNDMIKLGIKSAEEYEKIDDEKARNVARLVSVGPTRNNGRIFLGAKDNKRVEIIPDGVELPYTSELMIGYKLPDDYQHFEIPIITQDINGNYSYIARGFMQFSSEEAKGAYVTFKVSMGSNKVIELQAWASYDMNGTEIIEEGSTKIIIGSAKPISIRNEQLNRAAKINQAQLAIPAAVPIGGTYVKMERALEDLRRLCYSSRNGKPGYGNAIRSAVKKICSAQNRNDAADLVLRALLVDDCDEYKQRCFMIGRRIAAQWTPDQRKRLARSCMEELDHDRYGLTNTKGSRINTKIAAIMTLGVCGEEKDFRQLIRYEGVRTYHTALIYANARAKYNTTWIFNQFEEHIYKAKCGYKSRVQELCRAVAMIYQFDPNKNGEIHYKKEDAVQLLCDFIYSRMLTKNDAIHVCLALGCICDQRFPNDVSPEALEQCKEALMYLKTGFGENFRRTNQRIRDLALKLVSGTRLAVAEEEILLEALDL